MVIDLISNFNFIHFESKNKVQFSFLKSYNEGLYLEHNLSEPNVNVISDSSIFHVT